MSRLENGFQRKKVSFSLWENAVVLPGELKLKG